MSPHERKNLALDVFCHCLNSAGRNTIRRAVWSRCGEVWQNIKAADVAAGRRQTKAALYDVMGAAMHTWRAAGAVA
jgi:hypothetical protein